MLNKYLSWQDSEPTYFKSPPQTSQNEPNILCCIIAVYITVGIVSCISYDEDGNCDDCEDNLVPQDNICITPTSMLIWMFNWNDCM